MFPTWKKEMKLKQTNLIDQHGRSIHKLRLNLLDACNMRCMYCMPKDQVFKKQKDQLSPTQMSDIVGNLIKKGIDEVRLTGGEPLIHPQFKEIISLLSPLGLNKLGVTTNAIKLESELPFLKEHNVKYINISLDSLQEKSFEYITHTNKFKEVLSSILKAKEMGFEVKLNCVLLKNINYEELDDFINFSADNDIEIRFLELMKIGQAVQYFDRHFVSADEAIDRLNETWTLNKVEMPIDSTSFNFLASNKNGKIAKVGFIASETKAFCNGCSRLRLSSEGTLRPCIMINEGPNMKDLSSENYDVTLKDLIAKKPTDRLPSNNLKMNEIGG